MFLLGKVKIRSFEKGLLYRNREFERLLDAGKHWFFDPFDEIRFACQRHELRAEDDVSRIVVDVQHDAGNPRNALQPPHELAQTRQSPSAAD